ncbi:MAG: DUF1570 domain-containing protein [Planctomycetaceae bacterium]|nr:DUF1570 domain-containing protein [Planctomycetaceae bacterium]
MRYFLPVLSLVVFWNSLPCPAAPIVELVQGDRAFRGSPVVHNEELCWLAEPSGRHQRINLLHVTDFRKIPGEFRAWSATELASQISKTLDAGQEVQVRGDFVVVAPQGRGRGYASLLEQTSRSFFGYFARRNMTLKRPEFPLVVHVHSSKQAFDDHCRDDGFAVSPLLQGYYSPGKNTVIMYDKQIDSNTAQITAPGYSSTDSIDPAIQDTVIHETIHQLAFNTGLHSRIGQNPRWVVEGLAMMLEAEGVRRSTGGTPQELANPERLFWFHQMRARNLQIPLAEFVADDSGAFRTSVLNAYAQAWAVTFYLAQTRPGDYRRYLQKIADRNPLSEEYTSRERLADFQASFGSDIGLLDSRFLRYIDGLQ